MAKHEGLTVDQTVELAILNYLLESDKDAFAEAKKGANPEVLSLLEKS